MESGLYRAESIAVCGHKLGQPTVFIPVFPGTNCEYDSTRAFERAGARVVTKVFKNLTPAHIRESAAAYREEIAKAQIVMFPGGFSAGDERRDRRNSLPPCSAMRPSGRRLRSC